MNFWLCSVALSLFLSHTHTDTLTFPFFFTPSCLLCQRDASDVCHKYARISERTRKDTSSKNTRARNTFMPGVRDANPAQPAFPTRSHWYTCAPSPIYANLLKCMWLCLCGESVAERRTRKLVVCTLITARLCWPD